LSCKTPFISTKEEEHLFRNVMWTRNSENWANRAPVLPAQKKNLLETTAFQEERNNKLFSLCFFDLGLY